MLTLWICDRPLHLELLFLVSIKGARSRESRGPLDDVVNDGSNKSTVVWMICRSKISTGNIQLHLSLQNRQKKVCDWIFLVTLFAVHKDMLTRPQLDYEFYRKTYCNVKDNGGGGGGVGGGTDSWSHDQLNNADTLQLKSCVLRAKLLQVHIFNTPFIWIVCPLCYNRLDVEIILNLWVSICYASWSLKQSGLFLFPYIVCSLSLLGPYIRTLYYVKLYKLKAIWSPITSETEPMSFEIRVREPVWD